MEIKRNFKRHSTRTCSPARRRGLGKVNFLYDNIVTINHVVEDALFLLRRRNSTLPDDKTANSHRITAKEKKITKT